MLEIPEHTNYHKNLEKHNMKESLPCVICGKAVPLTKYSVIIWQGDKIVTHEEVEQLGGIEHGAYMGVYPIGADCYCRWKKEEPKLGEYVIVERNNESRKAHATG